MLNLVVHLPVRWFIATSSRNQQQRGYREIVRIDKKLRLMSKWVETQPPTILCWSTTHADPETEVCWRLILMSHDWNSPFSATPTIGLSLEAPLIQKWSHGIGKLKPQNMWLCAMWLVENTSPSWGSASNLKETVIFGDPDKHLFFVFQ